MGALISGFWKFKIRTWRAYILPAKKKAALTAFIFAAALFESGCGQDGALPQESSGDELSASADGAYVSEDLSGEDEEAAVSSVSSPNTMEFTDVFGISHTLIIDEDALMNDYKSSCFVLEGEQMTYTDTASYTSRPGIDVSYYQGDIDWEQVAGAGYEFVFIRIGYRGYGESGTLIEDENFSEYLEGARAAGLDVGVYFFSQALDEEEAIEEAEFVLGILDGTELSLPVVYDPEFILDEEGERIEDARTSDLSGEQATSNTLAFLEVIEEAGYEGAFYSNMLSESEVFDMSALSGTDVWYADYEETPQTPYAFRFWQYSESGTVPGIEGSVDLNIELIPSS